MDLGIVMDELNGFPEVMEFNEPATEAEIRDFQKTNNITLPPSYVEMLRKFDGGELFVPGTRIYGISKTRNAQTIKEINGKIYRKEFSIPPSMLIIGRLNFGDLLCIELNDKREIVQWDHENDEEFCRWNSLEEWIIESLDEYKKYEGTAQ